MQPPGGGYSEEGAVYPDGAGYPQGGEVPLSPIPATQNGAEQFLIMISGVFPTLSEIEQGEISLLLMQLPAALESLANIDDETKAMAMLIMSGNADRDLVLQFVSRCPPIFEVLGKQLEALIVAPEDADDDDADGIDDAGGASEQVTVEEEDTTCPVIPKGSATELHMAAFSGDVYAVEKVLEASSREERQAVDHRGNTALHLAVMRRQHHVLELLMQEKWKIPLMPFNSGMWTPMDEGIVLRDEIACRMIYVATQRRTLDEWKSFESWKLMDQVPDFSMRFGWSFRSKVFNALVKRFAPSDEYVITKRGRRLRVDFTLDIDAEKQQWSRSKMTLLLECKKKTEETSAILLNHKELRITDLLASKEKSTQAMLENEEGIDASVKQLMDAPVSQMDLSADSGSYKLQPVKYKGQPKIEVIGAYQTQVFEAIAKVKTVEIERKVDPKGQKMFEYEEYFGSNSLDLAKVKRKNQTKKVKAKCWMATDFPMTPSQFLTTLHMISPLSQKLRKAEEFVKKFSDMVGSEELFPVKAHIPVMMTVFVEFEMLDFALIDASHPVDPNWFEVPDGYCQQTLDEAMARIEVQLEAGEAARGMQNDDELDAELRRALEENAADPSVTRL